jgi:lysophospholipase L1-like esterase
MKCSQIVLSLALLGTALSVPSSSIGKPPYFILAGDSTTASEGGWGDALLSYLIDPADGTNPAKNGATTVSFRDEGLWDQALKNIPQHRADFEPLVTLQFGHNDQKPEKNITLDQFRDNLSEMAQEVEELGGIPVSCDELCRQPVKHVRKGI